MEKLKLEILRLKTIVSIQVACTTLTVTELSSVIDVIDLVFEKEIETLKK